jgi:hypothetical protein
MPRAASCHNAGTARIYPLAEIRINHRRTAPHAIRARARRTHLGHLLNRAPVSRVGHALGRT